MVPHRLSLLVLLGLSACGALSSSSDVAGQIHAAWVHHIDAAVQKDRSAVMQIYADDVTYVVPGSADLRGIEALRAHELNTLDTATVRYAEHTIRELRVLGDKAYEIGSICGPIVGADGTEVLVEFWFVAQWVREAGGSWKIRHLFGEPR